MIYHYWQAHHLELVMVGNEARRLSSLQLLHVDYRYECASVDVMFGPVVIIVDWCEVSSLRGASYTNLAANYIKRIGTLMGLFN